MPRLAIVAALTGAATMGAAQSLVDSLLGPLVPPGRAKEISLWWFSDQLFRERLGGETTGRLFGNGSGARLSLPPIGRLSLSMEGGSGRLAGRVLDDENVWRVKTRSRASSFTAGYQFQKLGDLEYNYQNDLTELTAGSPLLSDPFTFLGTGSEARVRHGLTRHLLRASFPVSARVVAGLGFGRTAVGGPAKVSEADNPASLTLSTDAYGTELSSWLRASEGQSDWQLSWLTYRGDGEAGVYREGKQRAGDSKSDASWSSFRLARTQQLRNGGRWQHNLARQTSRYRIEGRIPDGRGAGLDVDGFSSVLFGGQTSSQETSLTSTWTTGLAHGKRWRISASHRILPSVGQLKYGIRYILLDLGKRSELDYKDLQVFTFQAQHDWEVSDGVISVGFRQLVPFRKLGANGAGQDQGAPSKRTTGGLTLYLLCSWRL